MRVEFKSSETPFEGRANPLTTRQINKRRRMISHFKKSD
jgi:GTP-binding protein